jgi:hypothetical protein
MSHLGVFLSQSASELNKLQQNSLDIGTGNLFALIRESIRLNSEILEQNGDSQANAISTHL